MSDRERYRYVVIGTCGSCGGAVVSRVRDCDEPAQHPQCIRCRYVAEDWGTIVMTVKR